MSVEQIRRSQLLIRHLRWVSLTLLVALTACGGGGGSSPPAPTAPSGLSYPLPGSPTVGTALTWAPTVTGQVTSYSVDPALPPGLTLNTTTGIISGTPTAAAASASYNVTASNASGS